jgi:hypothetical protein
MPRSKIQTEQAPHQNIGASPPEAETIRFGQTFSTERESNVLSARSTNRWPSVGETKRAVARDGALPAATGNGPSATATHEGVQWVSGILGQDHTAFPKVGRLRSIAFGGNLLDHSNSVKRVGHFNLSATGRRSQSC